MVRTTKINSGTFDTVGLPLSLEARLEGRFEPSDDGSTLDYYLPVHDPVYLTASVQTQKKYIYVPGIEVEKFSIATPEQIPGRAAAFIAQLSVSL